MKFSVFLFFLFWTFSAVFCGFSAAASSKCLFPPTSDDPKVDLKKRQDCEEREKRLETIAKNQEQMNRLAEKGCAPNCPADKKEEVSGQYEIFCRSYCQAIVPKSLAKDISCSAKRMCSWLSSEQTQQWSSLGASCLQGVPEGGKSFVQGTAQAADSLLRAPRRLMESSWTFAKNVWKYGFHDAANMEIISADKTIRAQVKSVKAFPQYLSDQYEILKCLKPEVSSKLACNLGTVILLNAASGGASYKLLNAVSKAEMAEKAFELTAKAEKNLPEAAVTREPVQLNPETGLPIFPEEALKKNRRSLEEYQAPETQMTATASLNAEAPTLKKARFTYQRAKKNKDAQVAFLERAGYRFDEGVPSAVSAEKVGSSYNNEIARIAKEKGLSPSQIIEAARPYELPGGKIEFIKSGDPIPAGAKPKSVNLTDKEFMNMLAEGKFPLAESEPFPDVPITLKEHDAAHLASFEEYPEAMAELSKQAKELKARGGIEKHYNKPDEENYDPVRLRVFSTLETASFYGKGVQKKLAGLPSLKPDEIAKPGQLDSYFKKAPSEEISNWIRQANEIQKEQVKHFGGASRDIIHREYDSPVLSISRVQQTQNKLEELEKLRLHDPKAFEKEARRSLPAIVSTQWNFSQLDPVMMIRGSFKPDSSEGLKLREIQCASRGLSSSTDEKIKAIFGC